ncbi:MAG TPA: SpoVA/SpoVAEb family sporulation membrane protein [Clostridia bacterium]|nr:SpoVA/SpoVAEb family sporulation membrane protein [Clostridia bacterium]
MEIFLTYLKVFVIGGFVCLLGQLLINFTKLTSARILVVFLLLGLVLESVGLFEPIKQFAKAGATIPITGFGANLARGAIEGVKEKGLFGALTGGIQAGAMGISIAIFVGFVIALVSRPHTK